MLPIPWTQDQSSKKQSGDHQKIVLQQIEGAWYKASQSWTKSKKGVSEFSPP
jgi:hypothetical protein